MHEVSVQDTAGASGRACARPDPTDLSGVRGGHCTGRRLAGSHTHAAVDSAGTVAGKAGAVRPRPRQPAPAGRVSGTEEAILGTAHVGARVLLRDGGRGGRGNDQSLYREPEVGRRRSGIQDHSAHRALSRLSAGHLPDGFSRTRATFSRVGFYRLQPVVV